MAYPTLNPTPYTGGMPNPDNISPPIERFGNAVGTLNSFFPSARITEAVAELYNKASTEGLSKIKDTDYGAFYNDLLDKMGTYFKGLGQEYDTDPAAAAANTGRGMMRSVPLGATGAVDVGTRFATRGVVQPRTEPATREFLQQTPIASNLTRADTLGEVTGPLVIAAAPGAVRGAANAAGNAAGWVKSYIPRQPRGPVSYISRDDLGLGPGLPDSPPFVHIDTGQWPMPGGPVPINPPGLPKVAKQSPDTFGVPQPSITPPPPPSLLAADTAVGRVMHRNDLYPLPNFGVLNPAMHGKMIDFMNKYLEEHPLTEENANSQITPEAAYIVRRMMAHQYGEPKPGPRDPNNPITNDILWKWAYEPIVGWGDNFGPSPMADATQLRAAVQSRYANPPTEQDIPTNFRDLMFPPWEPHPQTLEIRNQLLDTAHADWQRRQALLRKLMDVAKGRHLEGQQGLPKPAAKKKKPPPETSE